MLRRKIESSLDEFYKSSGKYALLITGARQVGKTYIINEFARKHYDSYLEINFIRDTDALDIFRQSQNVHDILLRLSIYAQGKLKKGNSLIFFDEVQCCPELVTYIKFLVQEGSYRYVLSGSLLGVELKNLRSVPVGYMQEIQMYPLDFEEFLWANGIDESMIGNVRNNFLQRSVVDAFIHERLMRFLRLYLIVGGMPEAVSVYLESNDLYAVSSVQERICTEYRRDISQYDQTHKLFIREIFNALPGELNNQNRRFTIGAILKDSRFDTIKDGFLWLTEAGVAIPAYCVEAPVPSLVLSQKRNLFKLFSNDVGLLASMYMDGIQMRILNDDSALNIGAVYENFVAQELQAHGYSPFYFNSKKQGELDFLIENNGEVLPIEVKSGKNYKKHCALNNVLKNSEYAINTAYVLNNDNMSTYGKVVYAPIYMTMFIERKNLSHSFIYKIE